LGGWLSDKIGGLWTLDIVFVVTIVGIVGLMQTPSLLATTLLFMLCFAALGAGNGATFQLVPLRWPATTAVAGGMIGEIGALGGSILPNPPASQSSARDPTALASSSMLPMNKKVRRGVSQRPYRAQNS
ncbi:MAG: hypothetical protein ABSG51_04690, partial [Terracidiphilus sp.]|jgi:nitrate/nitrite transporter NarK